MTAKTLLQLNNVSVAAPCTMDWDKMEGGDVVRFCSQCQLNVYNLSSMPREEAERFVAANSAGKTCVRFYRRHDGTLLTRDCPVGVATLQAKARKAIVAAITVAASLVLSLFAACSRLVDRGPTADGNGKGTVTVSQKGGATTPPAIVMGQMCIEPPVPSSDNDLEISLPQPPETPAVSVKQGG